MVSNIYDSIVRLVVGLSYVRGYISCFEHCIDRDIYSYTYAVIPELIYMVLN